LGCSSVKAAHKILVKLTPVVNFTNVLENILSLHKQTKIKAHIWPLAVSKMPNPQKDQKRHMYTWPNDQTILFVANRLKMTNGNHDHFFTRKMANKNC